MPVFKVYCLFLSSHVLNCAVLAGMRSAREGMLHKYARDKYWLLPNDTFVSFVQPLEILNVCSGQTPHFYVPTRLTCC